MGFISVIKERVLRKQRNDSCGAKEKSTKASEPVTTKSTNSSANDLTHSSDDIRNKSLHSSEDIVSKSTNSSVSLEQGDKFYHVEIGDNFQDGRYVAKGHLGSGRYSSVWLVNDTKLSQHFALKILNSDFYNGRYELFELEVMEKISQVSTTSSHPGKDSVARIVNDFEIVGPTGKHVCMVYELLGSSIAKQSTQLKLVHLPYYAVKQVTRQLLQALDFLHTECGIIHTDISPSNICIELPNPEAAVAAAKADGAGWIKLPSPSLVTERYIRVRLNDFGIACFVDRHLTDKISPPLLRAPEITLGAPWDQTVDIFNLGALTLQFLTGQLPFPGKGNDLNAEGDRLEQLIRSFGHSPDVVLENADRAEEFMKIGVDLKREVTPSAETSLEQMLLQNATGLSAENDMQKDEIPVAGDMLRRMLATDPRKRASARELLRHPWLAA